MLHSVFYVSLYQTMYPVPRQEIVSVLFFKYICTFHITKNIQRVEVEKLADVQVDLRPVLSLPITDFNQYWNI